MNYPLCKTCGHETMPDCCWCGESIDSHDAYSNHGPVPYGCRCMFASFEGVDCGCCGLGHEYRGFRFCPHCGEIAGWPALTLPALTADQRAHARSLIRDLFDHETEGSVAAIYRLALNLWHPAEIWLTARSHVYALTSFSGRPAELTDTIRLAAWIRVAAAFVPAA